MTRKIDWSKHGAIACVTPNGKCVQTHVLIRSQKSAKWKLSKAIPIPLDLEDSANNIVHVCWNYLGNELATIDSSGRIFIFNTSGVLGRLTPLRSGLSDPDTELNGIIAMYWLPIAQYANKVRKLNDFVINMLKISRSSCLLPGPARAGPTIVRN